MIGGVRIIGGKKEFWIRGYVNGLRECLKTKGNMEELGKLAKKANDNLLEALDKREELGDKITEVSAFQSAVLDVMMEYNSFKGLFGCEGFAWMLVEKRINEVLSTFEEADER